MSKSDRNKIIGSRIVASRELRDVSAKELAEKIGVTPSRLSNWENATNGVNADYIYIIANALDVTSDYLLGLSDSPTKEIPLEDFQFVANTGISYEDLSEESKDKIKAFIKFMKSQEGDGSEKTK